MTTELVPAKPDAVVAWVERKSSELDKALAAHIPVEHFIRCAATVIRRNATIAKAVETEKGKTSLLASLFQSAQCNLPVGDGTQRSCLVPYSGEVQFQIMYQGLIDLAYRSGRIKSIAAAVVYPEDRFAYRGTNSWVDHEPPWDGERDLAKAMGAYAQAETLEGGWVVARMGAKEIIAIKKKSAAYKRNSGPWCDKDFEPAMWKKTVLKQLCKLLPKSIFPQAVHSHLEQEDARDYKNAREAEIVVRHPAPIEGPRTPEEAQAVVDASKPYKAKENEGLEETLTLMLGKLPPDISNKILDKVGISNLAESTDFAAMRKAIPLAEEALKNV